MFPKKLTKQPICREDYPVVQTEQGRLRGIEVEGAFIFRGIRYAKARRFHMPEKPDPWEGTRDALAFGPVCSEISTLPAPDAFQDPHCYYPQDEHCQYLNIWTPSIDNHSKKPVMLWLHGGGYQHGSPLEIFTYDGEELSAFGDVVVISIAHRLNVLGFLDLSAYGSEYRYSGVAGLADIVSALRWVHDNIAAFGGDPDNVMVFGQSGGGMKVADLLQMPAADGLYHKVSLQSGGGAAERFLTHEDARPYTDLLLEVLGLDAASVHELENVPYYKLSAACNQAEQLYKERFPEGKWSGKWFPVADGDYYLGHPSTVGFRQETKHIPMLIGTCLGEFSFMDMSPERLSDGPVDQWSEEVIARRIGKIYGEHTEEVRAAFRAAYPELPEGDAIFTDSRMRPEHRDYARARADLEGSAPVYLWLLTVSFPVTMGSNTAWHNAEEPFVFHNQKYLEAVYIPGVMDILADQMCGAWAAFAHTGDPNHSGIPYWPPVQEGQFPTMLFGERVEMKDGHDTKLQELYRAYKPYNPMEHGPVRSYGGGPRQRL